MRSRSAIGACCFRVPATLHVRGGLRVGVGDLRCCGVSVGIHAIRVDALYGDFPGVIGRLHDFA